MRLLTKSKLQSRASILQEDWLRSYTKGRSKWRSAGFPIPRNVRIGVGSTDLVSTDTQVPSTIRIMSNGSNKRSEASRDNYLPAIQIFLPLKIKTSLPLVASVASSQKCKRNSTD